MAQLAKRHHYIPQAYLRNWSHDGQNIWTYSLLVPHEQFPEWRDRPIRSEAVHEHLYSTSRDEVASDTFERWINKVVEVPAAEPLRKVAADQPLSQKELHALVRYAAALDVRTPTHYVAQKERWAEWVPPILQDTLERLPTELSKQANRPPAGAAKRKTTVDPMSFPLPFRLEKQPANVNGQVSIKVEVTAGREMWLHSMHRLLTETYQALLQHDWSIIRPHPQTQWFTSDHPVVKLNYYGDGSYDFQGGWGRKNSEFLLPLTPHHLLATRVGTRLPRDGQANAEITQKLQQFIAERASRAIYAQEQLRRVKWFRRRRVDANAFKDEQEAWNRWHDLQSDA